MMQSKISTLFQTRLCRSGLVLLFVLLLLGSTRANLVQDGNFLSFDTLNGSPLSEPFITPIFGQIGTVTPGSTFLTSDYWTSTGYNFVYNASNVDMGTQANGSNITSGPKKNRMYQIPGEGYVTVANNTDIGNTYMWGTNNGGLKTFTDPPGGGNFIASDPVYETGPIEQTITGLVAGQVYALSFYWGAAQQQAYDGATTEFWSVTLGSQTFSTPVYHLASHDFSGWMQQTFYYTATSNTEVLSFLAGGGPTGLPPFVLLGNVNLELVPEFSSGMLFSFFGLGCVLLQGARRRRASIRNSRPTVLSAAA